MSWSDFSLGLLAMCIAICCAVLLFMVHLIQWGARKVRFERKNEVAAVFCGTKKTLAAGVPMAKVIFGADPNLGMLLLPNYALSPDSDFLLRDFSQPLRKSE